MIVHYICALRQALKISEHNKLHTLLTTVPNAFQYCILYGVQTELWRAPSCYLFCLPLLSTCCSLIYCPANSMDINQWRCDRIVYRLLVFSCEHFSARGSDQSISCIPISVCLYQPTILNVHSFKSKLCNIP